MKITRLALAVLAAGLVVACGEKFEPTRRTPVSPTASQGVLDLRQWDFAKDGVVTLGGEWRFYKGALLSASEADAAAVYEYLSVPGLWEDDGGGGANGQGAGTYRVRILLPDDVRHLAVMNGAISTSFELEANGMSVQRGGRPALSREMSVAAYNPGVTGVYAPFGEIDFLVRVSNYEYRSGGIWDAFVLGPEEILDRRFKLGLYGPLAISAAIIAIALNYLIIFLYRRKEPAFLFFVIFGIVIAIRPLVVGEYPLLQIFPGLSFDLLIRIEYATAFLSIPSAALFFLTLFRGILSRVWDFIFTLPFVPFVLLILFAPLAILTRSIVFWYGVGIPALALLVVLLLGRAAYRNRQGGLALWIGTLILAVAGFNDILHTALIIKTGHLFAYSLAVFILIQATVLAKRSMNAFNESERLSDELALSNERLHKEIERVTEVGIRLESSLAEKDMLMREVHHRVKNSLQIVSSILALQAGKSKNPAVSEITKAIRDRIRAISIVHEKLYNVASPERIDLGEYARELVRLNVSSFGLDASAVEVAVDASRIEVDADLCIDAGLLLTELLTNSLKHAILPRGRGRVSVGLRKEEGEIVLTVSDDGPGFPAGSPKTEGGSLGFGIISTLVRKRDGKLDISEGPSPTVTCRLPAPSGAGRPAEA